jgi:hypothetical protein
VRHRQVEGGGLADEACVGKTWSEPVDHGDRPRARVLLVGDQSEDDVPGGPPSRDRLRRRDHRGHAALHVAGAPPQQATRAEVPFDPAGERLGHAGRADRVQVPVEHDGAAAP